jgi:hypothetical protein
MTDRFAISAICFNSHCATNWKNKDGKVIHRETTLAVMAGAPCPNCGALTQPERLSLIRAERHARAALKGASR